MQGKIRLEIALLIVVFAIGVPFFHDVGGYNLRVAVGTSMEPTVSEYSFVVLQNPKEIEVGEIVVFKAVPGMDHNVMHRIIAKEGEGFITKGDNNQKEDSLLVREKDIRWVYVYHSLFLSCLFAVFVLVSMGNLLWMLWDITGEKKMSRA